MVADIICLESRVEEAFNYLGLPDYKERGDGKPTSQINKSYLSLAMHMLENLKFQDKFLPQLNLGDTYPHSLRSFLYSIALGTFLGFPTEELFQGFSTAAMFHDIGKYCTIRREKKRRCFSDEDKENMEGHPQASVDICIVTDAIVHGIIERHHFWQKEPYPKKEKLTTSSTQEVIYLSKLLAIIDFYDSDSTRINSRTKRSWIHKLLRIRKLPPQEQVREEINSEYGDLQLEYNGESLPKIDCKTEELVTELYDSGVFGADDPLTPFRKPFSFLFPRH